MQRIVQLQLGYSKNRSLCVQHDLCLRFRMSLKMFHETTIFELEKAYV